MKKKEFPDYMVLLELDQSKVAEVISPGGDAIYFHAGRGRYSRRPIDGPGGVKDDCVVFSAMVFFKPGTYETENMYEVTELTLGALQEIVKWFLENSAKAAIIAAGGNVN